MIKRNLFGGIVYSALLLCAILTSSVSNAGTLALFTDINSMNQNNAGRNQMLANLLGGGTNVLVSRQTNSSFNTPFAAFYDGLAGVSATQTDADLNSGLLTGIDLLFINNGCCTIQPYSASESATILDFLNMGGTVGIVSEPCCGGDRPAWNTFMASIGSSMTVDSHFVGSQTSAAMTILSTFLTAGVTSNDYVPNTFNPIIGGTAAVQQNGRTAVAFESVSAIPVPAAVWLFGTALIGLAGFGKRRITA